VGWPPGRSGTDRFIPCGTPALNPSAGCSPTGGSSWQKTLGGWALGRQRALWSAALGRCSDIEALSLYRIQGKQNPAREILRLLDRRDNRNPFIYLQLGDMNSERGHVA